MDTTNPKPIADYPDLLSCKMVAEILQVGYTNATQLVRYHMPYIKIGKTYRIKKDKFVQWLDNSSKSNAERISSN